MNRHEDVTVPAVCGGRPLQQRARLVRSTGHDGLEPPLHNQLSHALCDIERHVLFIDAVRTRGAQVVPAMARVDDHPVHAQVQHIWLDLLREERRIRRGVRCRRPAFRGTAATASSSAPRGPTARHRGHTRRCHDHRDGERSQPRWPPTARWRRAGVLTRAQRLWQSTMDRVEVAVDGVCQHLRFEMLHRCG